eukprot:5912061-Ditylum_brightwellii.AAC.1
MKTRSVAGELGSELLVSEDNLDMMDALCSLVNKFDMDRDYMSLSDDEDIGKKEEDVDQECTNKSDSEN